jgi:hypothetical protein
MHTDEQYRFAVWVAFTVGMAVGGCLAIVGALLG